MAQESSGFYTHHESEGSEPFSKITDANVSTQKILVVDDDPLLLEIFAEYLTCQGYVVTAINDSRFIAENLRKQSFDFVICDYNMPEFSFEKDLLSLSDIESFPQVIMVTGDPRLAEDEHFPFPVLIKPFDFKQLKAALSTQVTRMTALKVDESMYQ